MTEISPLSAPSDSRDIRHAPQRNGGPLYKGEIFLGDMLTIYAGARKRTSLFAM